jgi:SSS family solute:Na+ symporter
MFLHLGFVDLFVLVAYFGSIVVVGMWVSRRQRNLDSYLLGDRDLPWWAILGSIVATETSAATVLSVPGASYGPTGMRFLQLALGYIVGRTIIVYTLLPLYFHGKLLTAYEVLHERFGGATKQTASMLFLITRNLGDGLRLYLAALVLDKLLDLPYETFDTPFGRIDVPFAVSVLLMGIVTIVYTYYGGMRLVVWNDCLQLVIYVLGGIAAVFVIAARVPGGWQQITEFASQNDKWTLFDFSWSLAKPYTFIAGLIGGTFLTIGTHGTDHMMVQRYLSARSQKDAGRALITSGFFVFAQFALFLLIGVELAAFYHNQGDAAPKPDQVFASFIVNEFPKNIGLIGLMLAAILAAALSSSLNASAAALVNDFYVSWRKTPASPEHLFRVTRQATIFFGIIQILVALGAYQLHDETVIDNVLAIAGLTFGLLLGVFALGVMAPRANQAAPVIGMIVGLSVLLYIRFILNVPKIVIAHTWFALIGCTITFVVGWAISMLQPKKEPTS